jgi:pimeloyl-ACP methyl ester carboxylesterase
MSSQKSTTVRTSFATRQRAVQTAFGVLERVAPPLGARWAERLWFTLPTVPAQARRARVDLPPGESFVVDHEGHEVRGFAWGSGPPVYLVHGWGGWGLQLAAYVPPLVGAGFRVITYDALSHGVSDPGRHGPRSTTLLEMADVLHAVVRRFGPAHAVVAHSIGAAATAHAMREGFEPGRLVFVAAANSFDDSVDVFARMLGFGPRIRRRLLGRFLRRIGVPIQHFDVSGIGADLLATEGTLPPLLAIHDRDDHETPHSGSVTITEGWPDAVMRSTDGLGHRQVLWHPVLVAEVTDYLARSADADHEQDRMAG